MQKGSSSNQRNASVNPTPHQISIQWDMLGYFWREKDESCHVNTNSITPSHPCAGKYLDTPHFTRPWWLLARALFSRIDLRDDSLGLCLAWNAGEWRCDEAFRFLTFEWKGRGWICSAWVCAYIYINENDLHTTTWPQLIPAFFVTTRGQSQETHQATESTILSLFESIYIYILWPSITPWSVTFCENTPPYAAIISFRAKPSKAVKLVILVEGRRTSCRAAIGSSTWASRGRSVTANFARLDLSQWAIAWRLNW